MDGCFIILSFRNFSWEVAKVVFWEMRKSQNQTFFGRGGKPLLVKMLYCRTFSHEQFVQQSSFGSAILFLLQHFGLKTSSGSTVLAHEQNYAQYTKRLLKYSAILECSISTPLEQSYCITGIFRGWKLSRIAESGIFEIKTFANRGKQVWHAPWQWRHRTQWKFSRLTLLRIASKPRNLRKFSHMKDSRYTLWCQPVYKISLNVC